MDISINWGNDWAPSPYEALHFDYESPYTAEVGETSLCGYLDLREFCEEINVSLKYTDAWGVIQDKIAVIISAIVESREEE